ncbi:MAG: hypothetical protein WA579_12790 [Rhodomicrobium sp.]
MVRQAHHEVFDKLTMRAKPLKARDLILSLSKDEVWIFAFGGGLPMSAPQSSHQWTISSE